MYPSRRRRILAPVPAEDPLLTEISALLAAADGDDPARMERTLTDGYARALALEAERRRLKQRIERLTAALDRDTTSRRELATLLRDLERHDGDLGSLRSQLGDLRRRHSRAVRAQR